MKTVSHAGPTYAKEDTRVIIANAFSAVVPEGMHFTTVDTGLGTALTVYEPVPGEVWPPAASDFADELVQSKRSFVVLSSYDAITPVPDMSDPDMRQHFVDMFPKFSVIKNVDGIVVLAQTVPPDDEKSMAAVVVVVASGLFQLGYRVAKRVLPGGVCIYESPEVFARTAHELFSTVEPYGTTPVASEDAACPVSDIKYSGETSLKIGSFYIQVPDGMRFCAAKGGHPRAEEVPDELADRLCFVAVPQNDPRGFTGYQDVAVSIMISHPQTDDALMNVWLDRIWGSVPPKEAAMQVARRMQLLHGLSEPLQIVAAKKGFATLYGRHSSGSDPDWCSYVFFIVSGNELTGGMCYFNQTAADSEFDAVVSEWLSKVSRTSSVKKAPVQQSSEDDFTIENGVLTRYRGEGGDVVIPDSVTEIGEGVFKGCDGLTGITIPDSVTRIGKGAFVGCTGLTEIVIPGSVTEISEGTFADCAGLTGVVIPDGVTRIGEFAFNSCADLPEIVIPDSVTWIGKAAFAGCTDLAAFTIPDAVTEIGMGAFAGCDGLTRIAIPEGVTEISDFTFYGCSGLVEIIIPDSVTRISGNAFKDCTGLTGITIPEGVTEIDKDAFIGCDGLTIHAPAGSCAEQYAKENGIPFAAASPAPQPQPPASPVEEVFAPTQLLNEFEIENGILWEYNGRDGNVVIPDSVTKIGGAFEFRTALTGITIPDSVTEIGKYAFRYCTGLTQITIPASVTEIGKLAFDNCTGLTHIDVAPGSKHYCSDGLAVFSRDGRKLLFAVAGISGQYSVPDNVTEIGEYAFYGCAGLTEIVIPEGVTKIGEKAFNGCTSLTSVTIPEGVAKIDGSTFQGCAGLTSVTIPNSVTEIGSHAFCDCEGLTQITIPEGVTLIQWGGFQGCTSLTEVVILDSVTEIDDWAFANCTGLTQITIPEGVTKISGAAFEGCNGLTIHAPAGSYAEQYAKENGIPFVAASSAPRPPAPPAEEAPVPQPEPPEPPAEEPPAPKPQVIPPKPSALAELSPAERQVIGALASSGIPQNINGIMSALRLPRELKDKVKEVLASLCDKGLVRRDTGGVITVFSLAPGALERIG